MKFFKSKVRVVWAKSVAEIQGDGGSISPRRWGKSSLVQQVADKIKKDDSAVVFCFVDLFNIRSEQEFYEALSRQVLKNTNSNLTEIGKTVGSFFQTDHS